jgi:hypothetical protein
MPPPEDQPLSQPTTSREHVSRINRSYFQRLSPFQENRRWLILAAVAIGVAWCAWGAIDVPRHYSPGAVASPHAKWENDCKACHVPLTPIKDATWLTTAETRREVDAKCEACHRGPAHHPLQIAAEAGSCSSCHTDHRGRMNDLTRVSDQTCTVCHANIERHRLAKADVPPASSTTPITRFDNEHHPPFASLAADPGRLKFSHGRHMRAGLTFGPTGAEPVDAAAAPATRGSAKVWTYDMLPPADRHRYLPADGRETDAIQLSCSSCHEFGTTIPPGDTRLVSGRLAASPPGAYPLPVEFERHCAACHVLPYEGAADTRVAAAVTTGTAVTGTAATGNPLAAVVPHGLDAEALRRFLESAVLERMAANEPRLLDRPLAPQDPLPAVPAAAPANPTVRALVIDRVAAAQTFVRGACEKCHAVELARVAPDRGLLGPAATLDSGWFLVPPTRVPQIWFAKAKFNHQPHRGYDCRVCHAAAYPDDASTGLPAGSPLDNGVVMIAGRESCTTCHAPAQYDAATKTTVGGVRFDCVECHGYHGLGPHGTR